MPLSHDLFGTEKPAILSDEEKLLKRQIYEQMKPRRRKFIDRIGYDQWDPFQEPKEPLDIRKDSTGHTLQELLAKFMRENDDGSKDNAWQQGAKEAALGIFQKNAKFQGIYDFCLWYANLAQRNIK